MKQLAIGLISGTSMDGVDAALVEHDPAATPELRLLEFATTGYPDDLRDALREAADAALPPRLTRLDAAVGAVFADAALALLESTGVSSERVACIGSHGQTICHLPDAESIGGVESRGTLQIGAPATIAARTGIVTVADFRGADMAVGGEGAPLAPLLDWRLYRDARRSRLLLNLGGIANVTSVPAQARLDDVIAFDTGPGNVLLDAAARALGLPDGIDDRGRVAAGGAVDPRELERLLGHEFLRRPPPKSADTADFVGLLETLGPAAPADLMATLVELTARSVADALATWIAPRVAVDEVLVSGGGVHNAFLMRRLRDLLDGASVLPAPVVGGVDPDAKEAVLFALLALERLAGRPGNVPAATGAAQAVPLGAVSVPPGRDATIRASTAKPNNPS